MESIKKDFETVVMENTALLLRYLQSRLKNKAVAEDLLQEIWIKAFRAYESYCEDGRLRPWLYKIAQNHLRNHFLQETNPVLFSFDGEEADGFLPVSAEKTPEEACLHRELVEKTLLAVEKLPKVQRQVITLRFLEGMTVAETAESLHIPGGSVKSKTHYALEGTSPQRNTGSAPDIAQKR